MLCKNAIGGSDEAMRLVGGPTEDVRTCNDPDEVTSPERGVTDAHGARSKARDSHACQQVSDTAATASHNTTHSARRRKLVDITSAGDALTKESRQLKREIYRLQREITQLSTRRSRGVQADNRDMISDTSRSSDVSNVQQAIYAPSHASPDTEGGYRSQTKDRPPIPVVNGNQPATVCAEVFALCQVGLALMGKLCGIRP